MSVILDALRKLDREKLFRRKGTANIAIEILRPDLSRPRKKIPLTIAIVSLTAFTTAAMTYVAMFKFGLLPTSSQTPAKNIPASNQQASPAPQEPGSQANLLAPEFVKPLPPDQRTIPAPLSQEPTYDARDEKSRIPAKTKSSDETKSPPLSVEDKKASQYGFSEKMAITPTEIKKTDTTQSESVTTPPSLKLSVIVWYEEPSQRFAMINGVKATEGSVIEGVKVLEIHPTFVRFSHKGQHFEISMSK